MKFCYDFRHFYKKISKNNRFFSKLCNCYKLMFLKNVKNKLLRKFDKKVKREKKNQNFYQKICKIYGLLVEF